MARQKLFRYLDVTGDGTGATAATGDYSSAVEEFKLVPSAGEVMFIHRMLITIEDTATMAAATYGDLAAALTNGIEVKVKDAAGDIFSLTDPAFPIKKNTHWGSYCYDVSVKTWGIGNEILVARWSFDKAGAPLVLSAGKGTYLAVQVNDDLQGLVDHRFLVQGEAGTTY